MIKSDAGYFLALVLLALFIWLRDTTWISSADDTLPVLVTLPLFYWLGMPWNLSNTNPVYRTWELIAAGALFLIGIALNSTLLLTLGWVLLLWVWLSARISKESIPALRKLMVLPILAFPWIMLDFDRIGWWFRLSGTWVTGHVFNALGFDVEQQGTMLFINGLPISIEVACAGLNTLQSMLIAGTLLDFIILGQTALYWVNIFLLGLIAWVANTTRIIVIAAVGLIVSPQFAMGTFHTIGGWLIILMMFFLCWFIFSIQEPSQAKTKND